MLRQLLDAAVKFTMHGDKEVAGGALAAADVQSQRAVDEGSTLMLESGGALPSPALQRVTDCLVVALQSANMTEVPPTLPPFPNIEHHAHSLRWPVLERAAGCQVLLDAVTDQAPCHVRALGPPLHFAQTFPGQCQVWGCECVRL